MDKEFLEIVGNGSSTGSVLEERSIGQETRGKNFWEQNGNFEKDAVVKNQGTKQ